MCIHRSDGARRGLVDYGTVTFYLNGKRPKCRMMQLVGSVHWYVLRPRVRLLFWIVPRPGKRTAFTLSCTRQYILCQALCSGRLGGGIRQCNVRSSGGIGSRIKCLESSELWVYTCEMCGRFQLLRVECRTVQRWSCNEIKVSDRKNARLSGVVSLDQELVHSVGNR
jgi:hypothetical protein